MPFNIQYKLNFSIKIFLVEIKVYFLLFSFSIIQCKLDVVCVLIAYCFAFDFSILQMGWSGNLFQDRTKISDQIFGSRTMQTKRNIRRMSAVYKEACFGQKMFTNGLNYSKEDGKMFSMKTGQEDLQE